MILVLGILILSAICVERNRVWADDFSLWRDVVVKAPLMPRGHLYLGNAHKDAALQAVSELTAKQHWGEAASAYQRVIQLQSDRTLSLRALNNLGSALAMSGEVTEAIELFEQTLIRDPSHSQARENLELARELEQDSSR